VKPPPFLYLRPDTLEGVLDALAEHGDEAKVLAGGQSLVPLLNFRLARPAVLVDLAMVPGLDGIARDNGALSVGAMVRQRVLERSLEAAAACPLLKQALAHVGHVQNRNRGTAGGSLAHADPAAELPAVAVALDAELVVANMRGTRAVAAGEFWRGPFETALQPDELLLGARFPSVPARTVVREFARRAGDFALAGVVAVVQDDADGPGAVALSAFGVAGTPVRLREAEMIASAHGLGAAAEAGAAASAAVDPPEDIHADSGYRRELVGVLVRRSLEELHAGRP
jgi:carbon-monoxide dehydrogenase medium subunit